MSIISSFFVRLGYDVDEEKIARFNEAIKGTGQLLKNVSLGAVGVASSFAIMFHRMSIAALGQDRFARQMGTSRDEVVAFNRASKELVGDGGIATQWIEQLDGIRNAYVAGNGIQEDFARGMSILGLSINDLTNLSPTELLLKMAEAYQALDEHQQRVVAGTMNWNHQQRNLMQGLNRGLVQQLTPSQADIEAAEKYDKVLKRLANTFEDALITFGTPLFQKLTEIMENLMVYAPQMIEFASALTGWFIRLGEAIGETAAKIVLWYQEFKKLPEALGDWFANTGVGKFIYNVFTNGQSAMATQSAPVAAPVTLATMGAQQNSTKVEQNINVEIHSNNPDEAGRAVRREVGNMAKEAQRTIQPAFAN